MLQRSEPESGSDVDVDIAPPRDICVLTVDDQESFLGAARQLVAASPGFCIVGEATCGEEAIKAAAALAPQLVLMDIHMPGIGGVAAAKAVIANDPDLVVVLTSIDDEPWYEEMAAAVGAVAFVRKQDLRPRLLRQLWDGSRPVA